MVGEYSTQNQRLNKFGYIILLVAIVLVTRIAYLQIVHGADFRRQADNNRIKLMRIMAPRGLFYDRNGVPLASNRPGFTISLVPISGPVPDDVIEKLASCLNMKPSDIRQKISQQDNPLEPIRIKNDVGPDIISKVEEHRNDLPGVIIEIQSVRNYVNKELGAHIFGYVSEISDTELEKKKNDGYKTGDIVGKFGLEKVYDKELRGSDGGSQIEIDVAGRPVRMLGKKEPTPRQQLGTDNRFPCSKSR